MKKILMLSLLVSLMTSAGVYAISPTYSNSTVGTMDFYPLVQHQMEKQETLDFANDSKNYKEKRAKKDAQNEYREGNKGFEPTKWFRKNKKMEFSTDSSGNIIIKDSSQQN